MTRPISSAETETLLQNLPHFSKDTLKKVIMAARLACEKAFHEGAKGQVVYDKEIRRIALAEARALAWDEGFAAADQYSEDLGAEGGHPPVPENPYRKGDE